MDSEMTDYVTHTVELGFSLVDGILLDPVDGEPLSGLRLITTLNSQTLYNMMASNRSAMTNPKDVAFADEIIAAFANDE